MDPIAAVGDKSVLCVDVSSGVWASGLSGWVVGWWQRSRFWGLDWCLVFWGRSVRLVVVLGLEHAPLFHE